MFRYNKSTRANVAACIYGLSIIRFTPCVKICFTSLRTALIQTLFTKTDTFVSQDQTTLHLQQKFKKQIGTDAYDRKVFRIVVNPNKISEIK